MLFIPKIIEKKRDGGELTTEEIQFFIDSLSKNLVDDSQIGAMLMAIYLKGLNFRETADLTKCMTQSGQILQFQGPLVDKHSTGGVGDKISLILAPALAACGFRVPMISGRGLAHTGGTLDKLESIPGFKVELTFNEMKSCLENIGCFIGGATSSLAPADGILYKHRDVTGTVNSLPLITSSILSKKAAEGISTLVMDMKVGCGATLETLEKAKELANIMIKVSEELGIKMKAVFSDMNSPIGQCVGNALEVEEAVRCLRNEVLNDVTELVKIIGGVILVAEERAKNLEDGKSQIGTTLQNKSALEKFEKMIIQQGVKETVARELCYGDVWKVLPRANRITKLASPKTGFIKEINALDIAYSSLYLGAGRSKPRDTIDHSVGVKLLKEVGDEIEQNEPWIEVHHKDLELSENLENLIRKSLRVVDKPVEKKSRILGML